MRSVFYLALSAIASLAAASDNPFNVPEGGYTFTAGSPTTLTWDPTTNGTVTLRLQWGAVFTTTTGDLIAGSIDNSGSYSWTPSADLAARSDYTVEIIDDDNTDDVNYTPRFSVSGATGAVTTSTASSTTSSASSTSSSTDQTSTVSATTLSTTTSSASSSTSTTTAASNSTVSATSSKTASSSSSNTASSSAATASVTTVSTNAGMANQVSIGMMALVFGAVALI
ncbi:GPI anchored serine-threonine rich family protein [Aspergillus luchuensis]|uniref:Yeast cell wall synthesis Kre9/Knh1-like N-terminal domain-containing protein n=2 Tax=Aspergillus kawachii TaxID=1069201 RepID=A0A146FV72_ASPKA|nr:uncharacterized protein AKAW2_70692A [Aspergillus luchuensis]OJZ86301.1 hypothetical protein ASPFODRAFT_206755 [Aspergillus luchuensis CBS 106.47]GAA89360.1 hypothetical protein AKAW_07474 [Aspergillus luchuensis IFO 4308]BCS03814.1 hypothetical protein AKAW2_70692A [Aspergillus luchuensis]BCS15429.1 hypothetical protein ALUC_70662A [Aspergillus luchuensis]GAT28972.1 hypothetical protein RIB2604_02701580 [Aspergillus luchuensis]